MWLRNAKLGKKMKDVEIIMEQEKINKTLHLF